jgi:hypothetical protein
VSPNAGWINVIMSQGTSKNSGSKTKNCIVSTIDRQISTAARKMSKFPIVNSLLKKVNTKGSNAYVNPKPYVISMTSVLKEDYRCKKCLRTGVAAYKLLNFLDKNSKNKYILMVILSCQNPIERSAVPFL